MNTLQTNNRESETARGSSSELGAVSWVEELWRRWEHRLREWERKQPFDSRTKLAVDVLSECITELRMQSRGSSTVRITD